MKTYVSPADMEYLRQVNALLTSLKIASNAPSGDTGEWPIVISERIVTPSPDDDTEPYEVPAEGNADVS